MAKRFVVECEWSGYHSGQQHICHRTVHTYGREKYEAIQAVVFTDGTDMSVRVRDCEPREKVEEKKGYVSLLGKIIRQGKTGRVNVMDVQ